MERPNIPLNCFFKGSYNPAYYHDIRQAKDKCWQYNNLHPNDDEGHERYCDSSSARRERK